MLNIRMVLETFRLHTAEGATEISIIIILYQHKNKVKLVSMTTFIHLNKVCLTVDSNGYRFACFVYANNTPFYTKKILL